MREKRKAITGLSNTFLKCVTSGYDDSIFMNYNNVQ